MDDSADPFTPTGTINADLSRTLSALRQTIADGLNPGAQLYLSLNGRTLADVAVGEARAGLAMRPDTLLLWQSAGKPVTAVAVAQLWERGLLELDDSVASHLPEFAIHGKNRITIRHLLTHTAGLRGAAMGWSDAPWEQLVRHVCDARPDPGWEPGQKAGYHVASTWIILGELVRSLDGRPFEQYAREMIFEPLGMNDSWIGLYPAERFDQYLAAGRWGLMHATSSATGPAANYPADTPHGASLCRPGGGTRGPIRELGRFYEMLLFRGQRPNESALPASSTSLASPSSSSSISSRILLPQTIEAMTARHRTGMFDQTFKMILDWGLGFIIQSDADDAFTYGFGPHASRRAFGHGGAQSSAGFADPERGLVVAFVFNGTPGEARHRQRRQELQRAIYEDLGFADD